jgi:hypothetical protein
MLTKPSSNIKHLDRDGRLTLRTHGVGVAWRVVPADRDRVDPAADYLFCAPDFLFPSDLSARALRVAVEHREPAKPTSRERSSRASRLT